jgi:hypothetical protein
MRQTRQVLRAQASEGQANLRARRRLNDGNTIQLAIPPRWTTSASLPFRLFRSALASGKLVGGDESFPDIFLARSEANAMMFGNEDFANPWRARQQQFTAHGHNPACGFETTADFFIFFALNLLNRLFGCGAGSANVSGSLQNARPSPIKQARRAAAAQVRSSHSALLRAGEHVVRRLACSAPSV